MYFDTAEEYTAEIALVRASIKRTLESQQYSKAFGSGDAVESRRVSLAELQKYLKELLAERGQVVAGSDSTGGMNRIYGVTGRI